MPNVTSNVPEIFAPLCWIAIVTVPFMVWLPSVSTRVPAYVPATLGGAASTTWTTKGAPCAAGAESAPVDRNVGGVEPLVPLQAANASAVAATEMTLVT